MLLVASPNRFGGEMPRNIMSLPMPLQVCDLVNTVEMMCQDQIRKKRKARQQPARRSDKDTQVITKAKELLMDRNGMTEAEAHRYIQKCSMDNGTNMVETAQMVISLNI